MWQPKLRHASLLILFILALVQPARADYRVTISVEGLACPFCTYGIEKRLKKLDFVRDIKSSLKDGKVTFRVTEGRTPDLDKVKAAVKRAGFTARDIQLTAIGTLKFKDKKIWLTLRGSKAKLSLADSVSAPTSETRKRLSKLAKAGVVDEGVVLAPGDGVPQRRCLPLSFAESFLVEIQPSAQQHAGCPDAVLGLQLPRLEIHAAADVQPVTPPVVANVDQLRTLRQTRFDLFPAKFSDELKHPGLGNQNHTSTSDRVSWDQSIGPQLTPERAFQRPGQAAPRDCG